MHYLWTLVLTNYLFILQINVDSIQDPKVGVTFDPKSLIQSLADVVATHMSTNVKELNWLCKWFSGARVIGYDLIIEAF